MARLRRSRTGRGAHAPARRSPSRAPPPPRPRWSFRSRARALRLRNLPLPPLASPRVFLRASPSPLTRFLPATLKRCCRCLGAVPASKTICGFGFSCVAVRAREFVFPRVALSAWLLLFASSECCCRFRFFPFVSAYFAVFSATPH